MKHQITNIKTVISLIALFALAINGRSQDLNKEVYVVSSYRPEVADADKISELPTIDDTLKLAVGADYTVLPSHLKSDFNPRPIQAATMVGTPLDKLYNSYLKVGLGNYTTPLAEFSIQNLRSKEYAVGAYVYHKSSLSKLELNNNAKVPAGYGFNDIAAYGKKFLRNAVASGEVGVHTHKLRFYGYNTANFPDSIPDIKTKEIKQFYYDMYGKAEIYSAVPDSGAFDYKLGLRGDYFHDYYKNSEPHVGVNVSLSTPLKGFRLGVDGIMNYYVLQDSATTYHEGLTAIRPFLYKRKKLWEIRLALNAFIENTNQVKIYAFPQASMRFQVVPEVMTLFFGVDGYVTENNYSKMAGLNPYILPGLKTRNTLHNFIGYGGLKGKLSSKAGYRLDVRFDVQQNNVFFANDTLSQLQNHFMVVYDDADLITYHAEVYWSPFSYLSFFARSDYYDYRMVAIAYPWQKPKFDLTFTTRYNFKKKIYANLDLFTLGKRYAPNWANPDQPIVLDPIIDLDLKLEYRYSNVLSGFIDVYDLTSQRQYIWNQYPTQRINILAGVTYKF